MTKEIKYFIKRTVEDSLNFILRRLQDLLRMAMCIFLCTLPFGLGIQYNNNWWFALVLIAYPSALWLAMTSWETFKEVYNININLKIKL